MAVGGVADAKFFFVFPNCRSVKIQAGTLIRHLFRRLSYFIATYENQERLKVD